MNDIVFETSSPFGHNIECTKKRQEHINSGHEIMKENWSAIEYTINSPNVIYKDKEYDNRQQFYSLCEATYSPLYTKVIVEVNDESMKGTVVTSFPTETISGGDTGGLLYVKNKLR